MKGSPLERFIPKFTVQENGCWVWHASTAFSRGLRYGVFFPSRDNRQPAHRCSYKFWVGEVPEGLELDHLCRNTLCVNPDHLEAVTHKINVQRGTARLYNLNKKYCPQGHEYYGDNLGRDKSGGRYCKECKKEKKRAYDQRFRNKYSFILLPRASQD